VKIPLGGVNGDEIVRVKKRRERREERREEIGGRGDRGDDMATNGLTGGRGPWSVSEKLGCVLCRKLATWRQVCGSQMGPNSEIAK
jgi:hypothetical protein